MGGMCGEKERGGLELSGEGRKRLSCTEQPMLMGLKKMVPGRKRGWSQGFRSREGLSLEDGHGDAGQSCWGEQRGKPMSW